jgi:hypothetical protein
VQVGQRKETEELISRLIEQVPVPE